MIWLAFGSLMFVAVLCVLLVTLMGRLMLAMLKKQGLIEANDRMIPKYRGRKDGNQPLSSVPSDLDLTNAPNLPVGMDGTV